eukprot:215008_1
MKLSIAAIALLTSTAQARLHPDDESKKNRELKPWGPSQNPGVEGRLEAAEATISELTARLKVLEATERIVFVTSVRYTGGQIDGIAGAHSKCQDLANAAPGLSGTFKAWLSNSTGYSPAQDFVKSEKPYVTTND